MQLDVEAGEVLGGNLVVEGPLGKGGMAEVFQVRDVSDGSRHALKVMTWGEETERKRLIQEGELQAGLRSEHVVQMRGTMRVRGRPALLMELVRGPTLSGFLRCREFKLHEAMAVFRGICMGVGAAHAEGLVHRDLKPANVLLDVVDGRLVPKVTDFGVAKDLAGSANLTAERVAIGTPRFMAPEQHDDTATVDRRADMWSLGCILYRLVCGVHAFPGRENLLLRVTLARFDPPRQHTPRLPEEVVFAIGELLHRDVEHRLPDVPSLFGLLEGRTALKLDDALGTIPKKARKPKTTQPTTLPEEALPEKIRQELAHRSDWERAAGLAGMEPEAPAPPPPTWAAADSLLPRTMTPSSVERMRVVPSPPQVGPFDPDPDSVEAGGRSAEPVQAPLSQAAVMLAGVAVGAAGALFLSGLAFAAWSWS